MNKIGELFNMKTFNYIVVMVAVVTISTLSTFASEVDSKIKKIGKKDKFAYVLITNSKDKATEEDTKMMLNSTENFVKSNPKAELLQYELESKAASSIVKKYRLSRAPMPLLLVFAPNGAVTGGYAKKVTDAKLEDAIKSPVEQVIAKASQERKPVIIRIPGKSKDGNSVVDSAIEEFKKTKKIDPEVIVLTSPSEEEAKLQARLNLDFSSAEAQTIVLTVAGTEAGRFVGNVTGAQIATALENAKSSCCAK